MSAELLRVLGDELPGRSLIDIGCGAGGLALGALDRGASRVTGVDLGAGAVAVATALARERGVGDIARFVAADGSNAPLEPHDVVTLNRAICCFPDPARLLANTLPAAHTAYAMAVPRSDGVVGVGLRAFARVQNAWFRLRRSHYGDFQVFIHDVEGLDATVRAAGFAPVKRETIFRVLYVAVYRRRAPQ